MAQIQWKDKWKNGELLSAAGCIIMACSTFLPYIYSDKKNWTLMEGTDGLFYLGFGVLILVFMSFQKEKLVAVLGAIDVYLGAYELMYTLGVIRTGHAVSIRAGYYVLLAGTLILLVGIVVFIYRNWLKNRLDKWFDKIFAAKAEKEA